MAVIIHLIVLLFLKFIIHFTSKNFQTLARIHLKNFLTATLLTTTDGEATPILEDSGKGNYIINLLTQ